VRKIISFTHATLDGYIGAVVHAYRLTPAP
jgi:hypothetical protein